NILYKTTATKQINAASEIFPRPDSYFKTIKTKRRKARAGSLHTTKNTVNFGIIDYTSLILSL
ncbi:hypothetical protein, partial [Klebsiella pneumoniae]|uniref:hypothetical protein n=1 Tax=Klebsiella pneumoniae TaxID=573 RepID=UPI003134FD5A